MSQISNPDSTIPTIWLGVALFLPEKYNDLTSEEQEQVLKQTIGSLNKQYLKFLDLFEVTLEPYTWVSKLCSEAMQIKKTNLQIQCQRIVLRERPEFELEESK